MSNVEVPFGDNGSETATLLLAAAEELGLDANVVQTSGRRAFFVPQEVRDKAFTPVNEKPAAKKSAAKRSTTTKE